MRSVAWMIPVLALSACATAGQTEFSTAGIGSIENAVECAARAIADEGFTVTSRDPAGLLTAVRGTDRLDVNVVPGEAQRYVINVRTTNTDVARDAAEDIMSECAT